MECTGGNEDRRAGTQVRRRASNASIDHAPGPTTSRNAQLKSCANSDRISCNTAHKPICGGTGGSGNGDVPRYRGIFVDAIATSISIINGTTISRVKNPVSSNKPPMISNQPSAVAVKYGAGNPSFVNRPTP